MTLKCAAHYRHLTCYSKIRPATGVNKERTATAKSVRESFIGSNKLYGEQCESVPKSNSKHGVHLEC